MGFIDELKRLARPYEDEEDEDEEDGEEPVFYEVTCPACGETITVDVQNGDLVIR